jgi:small-conductance mechanosensitive channel
MMDRLLDDIAIPQIWHKPIILLLWLIIIWIISKFIRTQLSRTKLESDVLYTVKKTISFATYVLFIIIIIVTYSTSLSGLTVALGVAGAGIAFALQEVIASFAGWLALLFGNFYKTGDRVELGGIKGDVIDIGILRTTLMEMGNWVDGDLYSGRIVRIANSFVFKEPVFNYSSDFPFLWDEIKIPIRYGSEIETTRNLLKKVVLTITQDYSNEASGIWSVMTRKYRIEKATTAPMITLTANDNWIEFTIRYVVNYKQRRITKDRLFTNILEEIKNSNGKVEIASATIQVTSIPELDINLKNK